MIVVPQIAELYILNLLITSVQPWIHLYTNDACLNLTTTPVLFVEATFPGYSPQLAGGWTDAAVLRRCAQTRSDPLVWKCTAETSAQQIWGYWATDGKTGSLLWAERRISAPIIIQHLGDSLECRPQLTLRGQHDPC